MKNKNWMKCLFLFVVSIFIFTQGLSVHGLEYRDDEIFYFQSTQEMVTTGNIWSPTYFGEDRFQKPILYYWLILISYKIFGINWFGARFVAVIFAALTVCLTWLIAREFFSHKTADLSAIILMTIPLFFRHAKNAVPDMALNFFIVLAVYYFIKFLNHSSSAVPFFIACALGFMIKGFAAWIVPIGTVVAYAFFIRKPKLLAEMRFGRGVLIMLLIVLPWFLFMIKTHGSAYLDYMLVNETKARLIGEAQGGNFMIEKGRMFLSHIGFYIKNIFSYFAPWSLFIFWAIPFAIRQKTKNKNKKEGLDLFLIWFGVVFLFFSIMHFVINHYMLVLSTPFAILVSYFLLKEIKREGVWRKTIIFLRQYSIVFIFGIGCLVLSFILVFLNKASPWWLGVFAWGYGVFIWVCYQSKKLMTAPLLLGLFIMFTCSQSVLLNEAGLTVHPIMQRFAQTIYQEKSKDFIIGVGSHDIHEKEFQVYFDQRIEKAATSVDQETRQRLEKLFQKDKKVYCLLTEVDYKKYLQFSIIPSLQVIQEDYMMRRRMAIDRDFFVALLKLDQKVVYDYLMEKVLLVRKG